MKFNQKLKFLKILHNLIKFNLRSNLKDGLCLGIDGLKFSLEIDW